MTQIDPNSEEMKQALKEALTETLHEQRELLHEVFAEVLEDFALAEAIREGRRTERVLKAHDEGKPREVPKPGSDSESQEHQANISEDIEEAKLQRDLWQSVIKAEQKVLNTATRLLSASDKASLGIDNLQHRYRAAESELAENLEELGIAARDVVELKVNLSPLEEARNLYELLKDRSEELQDVSNPDGYQAQLESAEEDILALQAQLDEPGKEYEAYLSTLETWNARSSELVGTEDTAGSIKHHERRLDDLQEVPGKLQTAYNLRLEKAAEIHREIKKLADTYRSLYKPVQEFIEGHPLAKDKFDLNFEVYIAEEGFENHFFAQINRTKSGSFWGSGSDALLNEILERYDFEDEASTLEFLEEVMEHLRYDTRSSDRTDVEVSEQLKQGYAVQNLYDFVFSLGYLKPRYTLRMADKDLSQLSPGERGTLLLIFYLLIDKDNGPLIIDQPDDNLDSETVWDLLVPCIKEAKKHRQLFLVTHNPNIAVAGDAEQIVRASIDRKAGNRITYTSGPMEDFDINEMTMDVLEGTRPAFNNRSSKYRARKAR